MCRNVLAPHGEASLHTLCPRSFRNDMSAEILVCPMFCTSEIVSVAQRMS